MTVIGVVSDTHFPRFGRALPRALERGLRAAKVERILHLGDMTDLLAVPLFEAIAPFDAVRVIRSSLYLNSPKLALNQSQKGAKRPLKLPQPQENGSKTTQASSSPDPAFRLGEVTSCALLMSRCINRPCRRRCKSGANRLPCRSERSVHARLEDAAQSQGL